MRAFWGTLLAESQKLGTLPGIWIAAAAAVVMSASVVVEMHWRRVRCSSV